jgi:hypothetical protein
MTTSTDTANRARLTERGQAYIGGRGLVEERKTVGNCITVPSGSNPTLEPFSKIDANSQEALSRK